MNFLLRAFFIVTLCLPFSVSAESADEAEPTQILNELFLSDTAYTQEKGEWQLSISPEYEDNDEGSRFLVPVSLEFGITDQLQVELEYTPYIDINSDDVNRHGQGNIELGLQYSWGNINNSGLNVALSYSHEFANGDRAVISEEGEKPEDEDNIYVVFSKGIGANSNTQAFLQLGRELQGNEHEDYANTGIYSSMGNYALSMELNWTQEQSFITPGITWALDNGWEFGLGTPIGIDGNANFKLVSHILFEWE
ncbi:MAG: hypothetical protein QNK15_00145 [Cycloclasticus sp.]|nr:hypothetical protein [Cycloclasticus sp.]